MNTSARSTALDDDVGLRLTLTGIHLIEASAGTGKTFTLATLYLRALVERRLRASEVLVVTFTEAATEELRSRLRARLELAIRELSLAAASGLDALHDDIDINHERRLLRLCLLRALQADDASTELAVSALSRHLSLCLLDLDQAPIDTFHAFCRRSISEHAFASRQALDPGELDGDDRQRLLEVADDMWRSVSLAGGWKATALTLLWTRPEDMAKSLRDLLATRAPLEPEPPDDSNSADSVAALRDALAQVIDCYRDQQQAIRAQLSKQLDGLKANIYSSEKIAVALHGIEQLTIDSLPEALPPRVDLLAQAKLDASTKKNAQTPQHPLFLLVDRLALAIDAANAGRRTDAVRLLHQLRGEARERLQRLKQQRRVRSFDDLIDDLADALDDPQRGDPLAAAIARSHPLALIDEFQDTDDRQWDIFNRVYGQRPDCGLLLVGDPKQAIYRFRNGDIYTYLRAKRAAATLHSLPFNYRSRPALIAACNALFGNVDRAFVIADVPFEPVTASGDVADCGLLRHDQPPQAVEFWSPPLSDKPMTKPELEALAIRATAADIADWLRDAATGDATMEDRDARRPLQPGDIAVLTSTNRQAASMQAALAEVGIAAVCAGQQSLFASDEALEMHRLLRALLRDGDARALRAALATELIGLSAAQIAALSHEADDGRDSDDLFDLTEVSRWRRVWQQTGVLALIETLLIAAAPRLLRDWRGERQISNFRHLAEVIDEARQSTHGIADQLRWLERRIANSDSADDATLLRLESDRSRVQIMTVHKSKGLEFGIVYLPFVALHNSGPRNHALQLIRHHDANGQLHLRARVAGDEKSADDEAAQAQEEKEALAESMRLIYVALTRARHAVRALWTRPARTLEHGLNRLFCAEGQPHTAVRECLDSVVESHADSMTHRRLGSGIAIQPLRPAIIDERPLSAPQAIERTPDFWRRHSFSALTRGQPHGALLPTGAASDEVSDPATDTPTATSGDSHPPGTPAGKNFGNALHGMLESIRFSDWRADDGTLRRPGDAAILVSEQLQRHGISVPPGKRSVDPLAYSLSLLDAALLTPLPGAGSMRLLDLEPDSYRVELEFEFHLSRARSADVLDCLQSFGYLQDLGQLGTAGEWLEGLLHGYIDLVYRDGERFYVLDYKSNRLSGYDADTLAQAMRDSRYDLQYLLYSLALHRWMRLRLGAAYDPERHYGGAVYLFLRGRLAADSGSAHHPDGASPDGVFFDRPPGALLHALDTLFEPDTALIARRDARETAR